MGELFLAKKFELSLSSVVFADRVGRLCRGTRTVPLTRDESFKKVLAVGF